MRLPVGALAERNFRLLFSSTTISGVGDGISNVALAFAVLAVSNSPVALGLVLAARQVANAGIVLAAGVWADRLPRHVILIAATPPSRDPTLNAVVSAAHAGAPPSSSFAITGPRTK